MKKQVPFILGSILFVAQCALSAENSNSTQQLLEQVKALQQQTGNNSATSNNVSNVQQNQSSNLLPNMQTNSGNSRNTNFMSASTTNNPLAKPSNTTQSHYESADNTNTSSDKPSFNVPFASQSISQDPLTKTISQGAFAGAVQTLLPMSPDQIHRLRQLYSASQYAAAAPAGVPPRATATSLFVDLSPGASPPAINLAEGDITALVFLDSTGAPWPIEALDNGNPNAFDIQWNKKDNVLLVQASSAFGRGNVAVRLRQLGPPVMITLVTNSTMQGAGGVVDYRVDLRIPGYGPNAQPVAGNNLPNQANPVLLDVLDGIPPSGSKSLDLSDNIGQAWLKNDSLFLRTHLTLLSPAWVATMSSADGTNAYQLQQTPLLLMSQNGKVIQVKVKGF